MPHQLIGNNFYQKTFFLRTTQFYNAFPYKLEKPKQSFEMKTLENLCAPIQKRHENK